MLHVGRQQLQRAFHQHLSKAADAQTASEMLLLIYAVECGLKCLLLYERGCFITNKLEEDDLTHNLDELLKKLGQSPRIGTYTLEEPRGTKEVIIRADSIHQVFRYGATIPDAEKNTLRGKLKEMATWAREQGI